VCDVTGSGIELDERDPSLHPGDDLYLHMNGRWLDRSPIPEDKARFGAFTIIAEEAEKAVRVIVEEAMSAEPGTEARKAGDLYASFMDEKRIAARGLTPLHDAFRSVDEAFSQGTEALVAELGRWERAGVEGLWQLFVDNDPGDPEKYVIFIEQGGIGLPDESYYREDAFLPIREAYLAHLERVFALCGLDEPGGRAARVMGWETQLASQHWDNVRCRDAEATYNPHTVAELRSTLGDFSWEVWREATGIPAEKFASVILRQPSFIQGLSSLWSGAEAEALRDWILWGIIKAFSPYLTDDLVEAHFDFFGRTLSGTPQIRQRWKRAVSFVEGVMGEAVGKLYVERHFPPGAKAQMDELVATLLDAYRGSIESLEWMSSDTKVKALEKLATFNPKIGYPSTWRDYSALEPSADDLFSNVRAGHEFDFQRELAKIGSPLDRDEWFMTPQTVNAYYNPGFNEIVFPAAILQYPFFDPERDAASNYGAIGAVIGHEIGHGFDDQGSRFDGHGRLHNWWSDEDRVAFEKRTTVLIDQFSALSPKDLPGQYVNGELTIGENIGDLGGLAIAWKAYQLSLAGQEPPVIDGLSAAQRFFLSWAQSWKLAARKEEAQRLLQIDPHSPSEFRCNQIARNLDEFYEAFGVTPEHQLWLDPQDRVSIW
jgi:putative endopeptidase